MGGGYKDVIAIPVDDPDVKAIAGAFFKPEGTGPFPAIVYLGDCGGLAGPTDMTLQKIVIEHHLSKGVATLILDPYTPRNEPGGVCETARMNSGILDREINDAYAALATLAATPGIDAHRIFLQTYGMGGYAGLLAVDTYAVSRHKEQFAGLIAFYPGCDVKSAFVVPTIVFVGDLGRGRGVEVYGDQRAAEFSSQSSTRARPTISLHQASTRKSRASTSSTTGRRPKTRRAASTHSSRSKRSEDWMPRCSIFADTQNGAGGCAALTKCERLPRTARATDVTPFTRQRTGARHEQEQTN